MKIGIFILWKKNGKCLIKLFSYENTDFSVCIKEVEDFYNNYEYSILKLNTEKKFTFKKFSLKQMSLLYKYGLIPNNEDGGDY